MKQSLLHNYHLGTLGEREQEQVEEEYFSQPERRQELWAIFDEMVESFVQGEMELEDARAFAHQLQNKPGLRARAERLYMLYDFLATTSSNHSAPQQIPIKGTLKVHKWFSVPAWSWGVIVVGAISLGIAGLWRTHTTRTQINLTAQGRPAVSDETANPVVTPVPRASSLAAPTQKNEKSAVPALHTTTVPFYILLEDTRAQETTNRLSITKHTETIVLYFEAQPPFQPTYRGTLQSKTGQVLKVFPNLKAQPQKSTSFISLRLAVADLSTPDFAIQIKADTVDKNSPPLVEKFFRLENK